MIRLKVIASVLLTLQLFLGALAPSIKSEPEGRLTRPQPRQMNDDQTKQMKKGLQFRLSAGSEQPDQSIPVTPAKAASLTESDVQKV